MEGVMMKSNFFDVTEQRPWAWKEKEFGVPYILRCIHRPVQNGALKMISSALGSLEEEEGKIGLQFLHLDQRTERESASLGTNVAINSSIETSVLYSGELCASLVGSCFGRTYDRQAVAGVSGPVGGGDNSKGSTLRLAKKAVGFLSMTVRLD